MHVIKEAKIIIMYNVHTYVPKVQPGGGSTFSI